MTSDIRALGLIATVWPAARRYCVGDSAVSFLAADRIVGHDSGVTWRAIRQVVRQPAERVLWQWSSAKTAERKSARTPRPVRRKKRNRQRAGYLRLSRT